MGKLYLIRLKHSSLYNELLSGWHFICFSLVLFLILVNSKSFFVGLCLAILLFYLSKLNKRFVVLLVILFIIIGSKLLIYEGKYQNRHLGDYYGYGIIEKPSKTTTENNMWLILGRVNMCFS